MEAVISVKRLMEELDKNKILVHIPVLSDNAKYEYAVKYTDIVKITKGIANEVE